MATRTSSDLESVEIYEWIDSLDYVLEQGTDRTGRLLEELGSHAHQRGVELPFIANTPHVNTIPANEPPVFPGSREIERRNPEPGALERDGDGRESEFVALSRIDSRNDGGDRAGTDLASLSEWEGSCPLQVTEIASSSTKGFDDAVKIGIERAAKTLDQIEDAWASDQKGIVNDGKIDEYRVNMKMALVLKE